MKTTCLLNFLSFAFLTACNFEFSDIPYFNEIFENAYFNSLDFLKLLFKSISNPVRANGRSFVSREVGAPFLSNPLYSRYFSSPLHLVAA
jgi:hypothetical protein